VLAKHVDATIVFPHLFRRAKPKEPKTVR